MPLRHILPVTCLAVSMTVLAACATAAPVQADKQSEVTPSSTAPAAYILGAGDSVRIGVFGQPDLSGEFEVDSTGAISFPLIGEVRALGLTPRALETAITERLADGYLQNPVVSAEVTNYRPFYILGEVANPGEYPYTSGLTVMNAVASAGGFTYRANKKVVYIRSFEGESEEAVRLESITQISPGDTIRIGERIF